MAAGKEEKSNLVFIHLIVCRENRYFRAVLSSVLDIEDCIYRSPPPQYLRTPSREEPQAEGQTQSSSRSLLLPSCNRFIPDMFCEQQLHAGHSRVSTRKPALRLQCLQSVWCYSDLPRSPEQTKPALRPRASPGQSPDHCLLVSHPVPSSAWAP